jgi:hypothetical protein
MQDGCRAELEGVTFSGHADRAEIMHLPASMDAPAVSQPLHHEALSAFSRARAQMRGETYLCITAVEAGKA